MMTVYASNDNELVPASTSEYTLSRNEWCAARWKSVVVLNYGINARLDDEYLISMKEWCQKYIHGHLEFYADCDDQRTLWIRFYFDNPKEAMLFKLKWC